VRIRGELKEDMKEKGVEDEEQEKEVEEEVEIERRQGPNLTQEVRAT